MNMQNQRFAVVEMLVQQLEGAIVAARRETDARSLANLANHARSLRDDLDNVMAAISLSGTCADRDGLWSITGPLEAIDASDLLALTR